MISVLALGLLLGMQHALEADHVAAVSAIAARQTTVRRIVVHGAVWGVGHTLTLMAVSGLAIILGTTIIAGFERWLETAVGFMLVALGGQLIYRLVRDRIHFHMHRHGNEAAHLHAHSHAGDPDDHARSDHDHDHPRTLPIRTLLVGVMQGLAGSAALLILTASSVQSPMLGFAYVGLFGLGSVAGMAALSAIIAVPLAYSARFLTWAHGGLQGVVGVGTVALGIKIIVDTQWPALAGL